MQKEPDTGEFIFSARYILNGWDSTHTVEVKVYREVKDGHVGFSTNDSDVYRYDVITQVVKEGSVYQHRVVHLSHVKPSNANPFTPDGDKVQKLINYTISSHVDEIASTFNITRCDANIMLYPGIGIHALDTYSFDGYYCVATTYGQKYAYELQKKGIEDAEKKG